MKFVFTLATAAALLAASSNAFSPSWNTPASPGTNTAAVDDQANDAMSQYEAALKAAFDQAASANAIPSPANQQQEKAQNPVAAYEPPSANPAAYQQDSGLTEYETALRAAMGTVEHTAPRVTPPSIVFGEEATAQPQPDWGEITDDITAQIEMAESEKGAPLDASAKGEIIGAVLAGSAVLTTHSPLLVGAALGYAGTHVFGGERGEELRRAGEKALKDAFSFTQETLEEERGDISKASGRILEHLQDEAILKAREMQRAAEDQAQEVSREISNAPAHLVEEGKKFVESDDFKQMPGRTFRAVQTFLGSEEVRRAKENVVKSIQDGLESEEFRAVKDKATHSLKNM